MAMFNRRPGATVDGEVDKIMETAELRDAILYDFDIDDDTLKLNHKHYLDDAVQFLSDQINSRARTVLPGQKAWTVSIDGFASKTGQAAHNEYLSKMREAAVEAYLHEAFARTPALGTLVSIDSRYHGFRDSPATGENPKYRSARVAVHRPGFPPPPIDPGPSGSTEWKIRVFRAAGGSIGPVQGDVVVFQILDVARKLCGVYYYIGAGFGIAVPKIPAPGSIASAGPYTDFNTTRGVSLSDFEGEAGYHQNPGLTLRGVSVGGKVYLSPASKRLIALPGTRKTILKPDPIPMSTGSGFSIGLGSTSTGRLSKPVIFKPCCGGSGGGCTFMK